MASDYTLVLLGRFPGKDRAVASALAREFGRDEAWAMQVVGAAPIVLLDALSGALGDAIYGALAEVEAAGCRFEIQHGSDPNLAKLTWPGPARIRGKLVSELLAASGPGAASPPGSTATLMLPCPYTGQKMKVSITITLSKAGNQMNVGVAATATAAPAPVAYTPPPPAAIPSPQSRSGPISIPVPMSAANNAAYRPIPTPVVNQAVGRNIPAQPQARRLTPAVGTQEQPVIFGLDSLDELTPMEPATPQPVSRAMATPTRLSSPPMQIPRSIPSPASRPYGNAAPLPDVPVIYNQIPMASPSTHFNAQNDAPMPMDLLSAPMDLSQFEANVSASGIMRAVQVEQPDAVDASSSSAEDDGSLCSVSIGKSGSPKVHQVVSNLLGLPLNEASRLCQKPIVTLAKDISFSEARDIRQQLSSVNVVAKITKRK